MTALDLNHVLDIALLSGLESLALGALALAQLPLLGMQLALIAAGTHLAGVPLVAFVAAVFKDDLLGHGLYGVCACIRNCSMALFVPLWLGLVAPWLFAAGLVAYQAKVGAAAAVPVVAGLALLLFALAWAGTALAGVARHAVLAVRQLQGEARRPTRFDVLTACMCLNVFQAVQLIAARRQASAKPTPFRFQPISQLPPPVERGSWEYATAQTIAVRSVNPWSDPTTQM
jgi:hypothetical protein